jgi:hypothetical protein
MKTLAAATAMLAFTAVANAGGPTARFGLTGAAWDQSAPGKVVGGPELAVGVRGGRFVAELEWAYLSFFDADTTGGGVQRLGVSLRADILRSYATHCIREACTHATTLWADVGAGERFGQWLVDAHTISPAGDREPELHATLGIELDNQAWPMRNGWQLGVRFAVSPRGVGSGTACRTADGCVMAAAGSQTTAADKGGYDDSILLEWMFLFGR